MTFTMHRLIFATAREEHVPQILAFLSVDKRIPVPGLTLYVSPLQDIHCSTDGYWIIFYIFNQASLALLFLSLSDQVMRLISFAIFITWFTYVMIMIALLIQRRANPGAHRPFRVKRGRKEFT